MKTPAFEPLLRLIPEYIADFDATTANLIALGNFLQGEDFSGMGQAPPMEKLSRELDKYSQETRQFMYAWGGYMESIPVDSMHQIFSDQISEWVIHNYQPKQYPVIAIGSGSGAQMHLCAALGIPWLPQSFLIPVERPEDLSVDEPKKIMAWAQRPARILLENNPDLQLHHMFDPVYDRLMLQYTTFFRIKKLQLGIHYERFIKNHLAPGGTLLVFDCQSTWPVTRVDQRHFFQFGSPAVASANEYQQGGPRLREYLKNFKKPVSKWNAPPPDWECAEAEWGFEKALLKDIEALVKRSSFQLKRLSYKQPEHLSPFVAEIYRWWHHKRNMLANRMIAGSFMPMDPYWIFKTGSVPFWLNYNREESAAALEHYLSNHNDYDEIYLMLFAHGIGNQGLPSVDRWRSVLARARKRGQYLGSDNQKAPFDLAAFIKYNQDIPGKIQARYPLPAPLSLKKVLELHDLFKEKVQVEFSDHARPETQSEATAVLPEKTLTE